MIIKPGVGLGPIKFGFTEGQVIGVLGEPEHSFEKEYVKGCDNWKRELWYENQTLGFTFDEDDEFKLGTITVRGTGFTLQDRDLFAQPIGEVRKFLDPYTSEPPDHEVYIEAIDQRCECLEYNELGMMVWFELGALSDMQCSYLFESDGETIIWPS